MKLKDRLKSKIKNLEEVIEFRDNDEEWLKKLCDEDMSDTNEYFWFHGGIGAKYHGKLEALKDLLKEL